MVDGKGENIKAGMHRAAWTEYSSLFVNPKHSVSHCAIIIACLARPS